MVNKFDIFSGLLVLLWIALACIELRYAALMGVGVALSSLLGIGEIPKDISTAWIKNAAKDILFGSLFSLFIFFLIGLALLILKPLIIANGIPCIIGCALPWTIAKAWLLNHPQ